jgi:hypothetical protein
MRKLRIYGGGIGTILRASRDSHQRRHGWFWDGPDA